MLHSLEYVLWIVPTIGQVAVAIALVWRRLVRMFPMFFAYICSEVATSVVLYFLFLRDPRLGKTYFIVFWSTQTVVLILQVFVVQELFSILFKPYESLYHFSGAVFRGAILVFVGIAVLTTVAAPGVDANRISAGVFVLGRSVRLVQVGVMLALFLLAKAMGISWRNRLFGIAVGFGIAASVQLAAYALRAEMGFATQHLGNNLRGAGTLCAVLLWATYTIIPERRDEVLHLPAEQLREWNQALAGFLRR